jgi:hypothetical protein
VLPVRLLLVYKFLDNMLRAQVQINLCSGQMIVAARRCNAGRLIPFCTAVTLNLWRRRLPKFHSASLLATNQPLTFNQLDGRLIIKLPAQPPDSDVTVIRLRARTKRKSWSSGLSAMDRYCRHSSP